MASALLNVSYVISVNHRYNLRDGYQYLRFTDREFKVGIDEIIGSFRE